jgi:transcriptional regulator GlxA family with amidase domain
VTGSVRYEARSGLGRDEALHLVADRHGPATAARIARTMVVYTRRNGAAAQDSAMPRSVRMNKVIDVRDMPTGTLVQDPTYSAAEKKFFRVP